MAGFLNWMMSFSTMAISWIVKGFAWFSCKRKDFSHVLGEHHKKLGLAIPSLEKRLKDMGSSSMRNVLNKNQCVHLCGKLLFVMKNINKMLSIATNDLKFQWVMEELFAIQGKVELVERNCTKQKQSWCHLIVFQLQNKETFRELLLDLKCCYDVALDVFSLGYSNALKDIECVAFDAATCQQVREDGEMVKKKIEDELSTDHDIAQHLLLRLRNLDRVDGGDLDALEFRKDFKTPQFFHQVGEGAWGKVFQSNWLGLACATKILKGDHEYLVSCRKEVGILAGLSHPNLVQFLGCGINEEVDGDPEMYMVMELMETSLSTILKDAKGPLPYHLAIDIMHQIAKGVYYLHDMGVAHLDLKPANVLSSSKSMAISPTFKVTDYGTSRLEVCNNPKNVKPSEYTVGTREYMAPEVMQGSGSPLYPFQADVWSFAMMCSEILSRKVPCLDLDPTLPRSFCIDNPKLRPALPNNCRELTTLIEECWSFDPRQRPSFSSICARLASLKKSFLMGTYAWNMIPQFDFLWVSRESILPLAPKAIEPISPQEDIVEGMEHALSKATRLLKMNYVGIVGMGGIGKTTLAKALFDNASAGYDYDASCFVDQSKNYPSPYTILCEILPKLRGDDQIPKNVKEAKKMMEALLVTKKVLLVLDDVDNETLVEEIVPPTLVQASKGTTIIMTTRKWSAIESWVGMEGRLDVDLLDEKASTKLFNSHVGGDVASMSSDFADLRQQVVKSCNGLPLSLKVMGAFLRGKERLRSWERALQRMARGKDLDGDESIWKTLQVSFDGLNNDVEKQMFLDVACFFCQDVYPCGISRETILLMWSKEGLLPVRELERLIDMSLMKLSKEGNILEMHDQLRDMGRRLSKGTRIWKTSMIPESGFSRMDAEYIEGISWRGLTNLALPLVGLDPTFQFKNLRILILRSEADTWFTPTTSFDNFILFLQFASQCCQLEALLIDFTSNKGLPRSLLEEFAPILNGQFSKLCNICSTLKILDVIQPPCFEEFPNNLASRNSLLLLNLNKWYSLVALPIELGSLSSLTTLNLRDCGSLRALPIEVGNLSSVKTLDLSGCLSLAALPVEVGHLSSLKTLDLSRCSSLAALPIEVGNLSSLKTLNLSGCSILAALPVEVGNLSSLTTLCLSRCWSLVSLPVEVGNLSSLTTLNLSRCSSLVSLPVEVGNLCSLTSLDLWGCSSLVALPVEVGNLSSLTSLYLSRCSYLVALPVEVGNLSSLTTLNLWECSSLTALPVEVGNLSSLTTLDLSGCSSLATLPIEVGNLSSLKTLDLSGCCSLVALPIEVGNLSSLTSLDLGGCSSLAALPVEVGNLSFLTSLDLSRCLSLATLPNEIGNLSSLTTLDLSRCSSLAALPNEIGNLSSLTSLYSSRCSSLAALPVEVGNLSSLNTLDLSGCSSLVALPVEVGNLSVLTTLNLRGCLNLASLPIEVGNLSSLTTLDLSRCLSLVALPNEIGNLSSLVTLNLSRSSSLVALPVEVGNLSSLRSLYLSRCSRLASLPVEVGNLSSLTTLDLSGWSSLVALPIEVGNLSSLTSLYLSRCSRLASLPVEVGNLSFLTTLNLSRSLSLVALPVEVGNLSSLTSLYLSGCLSLASLPVEVGNLSSLTTLDLSGWLSLASLPIEVGNLSSLTTLDLSGCSSLATLRVEVGNLSSLTSLDLSRCLSLTSLPVEVGNLSSLTTLNLRGCSSLASLPVEVGNLCSLTSLDLWGCSSLAALPVEVGNLSSLTSLYLSRCSSLAALPVEVGNLSSLTSLNLWECSSLASLPVEVGNLSSLTTLDLSGCSSLAALPFEVGNLSSLKTLDLSGCSSLVTLPVEVGNLSFS